MHSGRQVITVDFDQLTIGYVGLGLIGGSIAKALRAAHPHVTQLAYCRHPEPTPGLSLALQEQVIDRIEQELTGALAVCDVIFLCAPVLENDRLLRTLAPHLGPNTLVTDVGSVKSSIQKTARDCGLLTRFLGGHPMAGSEKTGYENSTGGLLENAYYILTPEPETPAPAIELMTQVIRDLSAIPVILSAKEHDKITAAISHLPHVIASSLVNLVQDQEDERELYKHLAAGGFKDITRIASSSPEMWQDIAMANRESLLELIALYQKQLSSFSQVLKEGKKEALFDTFSRSREYRDSIPNRSSSLVSQVFDLYVDIPDETGAIAILASMLAANGINIKNIGIIHNREFAGGVLHVELYEASARERARDVLSAHHYTIYER